MSKYRVLVADNNEFLASFDRYYKAEMYAMQMDLVWILQGKKRLS